MKLRLSLAKFFELVDAKFFYKEQGDMLFNAFLTGDKQPRLPYVTKGQLKILRAMGAISID